MTDLVRKSLNLAFVALLTVWTLVAGFFIFRVYLTGQTPLNPATGFHSDYVRVFVLGKMMNQYGEKAVYDKVIHERRACPRNDLATLIANGKVNGCPMDHRSMISYFVIASTAGHDTTAATTASPTAPRWDIARRNSPGRWWTEAAGTFVGSNSR